MNDMAMRTCEKRVLLTGNHAVAWGARLRSEERRVGKECRL